MRNHEHFAATEWCERAQNRQLPALGAQGESMGVSFTPKGHWSISRTLSSTHVCWHKAGGGNLVTTAGKKHTEAEFVTHPEADPSVGSV